jgi:hypothetical protein
MVVTVSDINDELDALLARISSPESRRAGDALFSADPLDLSLTYSPGNFDSPNTQSDFKGTEIPCKK